MTRHSTLWAMLLILAFALQAILTVPRLSVTSDEVAHLPAGYSYWATRDFRLNPEHPPLAKLLAAAPLMFMHLRTEATAPAWAAKDEWSYGFRFLYGNDADRVLFWGRLPMVLFGIMAALVTFLWARDLFGPKAGLFALGLYAFCPNILAHTPLVTTDIPVASFIILSLYCFWKQDRFSIWSSIALGAAVGGALATKFSGVLLIPLIPALALWRAYNAEDVEQRLRLEVRNLLVVAVGALAVVHAAYLFSATPRDYIAGLRVVNTNHDPNRVFYLFGSFNETGWWYYFLLAFIVKATLPFLITLALAVLHFVSKRFDNSWGEKVLLVSTLFIFAITSATALPIGIRYVIPLFPLLFVWGSRVVLLADRYRWGNAILVLLIGWQMFESVSTFPNYIPYFNEAAGGARHSIDWLDDSNVDWGQGLKDAARYVKEHHIENAEILPFSPLDNPQYYGVPAVRRDREDSFRLLRSDPKPPGIYIVSGHNVIALRRLEPKWKSYPAIDRIGDAFWVYKF